MSKIGIYPGSFDPITLGHLDIIQRSLHVVDKLIIAVSNNKSKNHMISIDDRLDLIKKSISTLPNDIQSKIEIEKFDIIKNQNDLSLTLQKILRSAKKLNPNFLSKNQGGEIITTLDFSKD